mmetsp:Transcript_20458/g.28340  ORF Transcript_20458/g.28340 Transcript_20458/m.28340 type:complete len:317 (+) Transcript_20458:107-1057(+)|eukprot:CAMPEP_0196576492 /NCGR_PEP_ID=MMETSP1081-20130531/5734_1 /TAXON_ID=36882 /ORGANISM="Pyramimonas amylifera, Strain CCMP720" /LENGTH=316 /DNA_ID=CAMNT_0041895107 /DNA_START=114 /DNA_END=1064 /DNA_ORIENTATION=+
MHKLMCNRSSRILLAFQDVRAASRLPANTFSSSTEQADTSARGQENVSSELRVPGSRSLDISLNEIIEKSSATTSVDSSLQDLPHFVRKPKPLTKPLREALTWIKESSHVKFNETVDLALRLGVDPKRSDQVVRGMAVLPYGTGKVTRVAVFARGAEAEEAVAAGADLVGAEDIVQEIKKGGSGAIKFDRAIAHPSVMPLLSQVARILGPRGLMPNPKLGTLTTNITDAVKRAKQGQVEFKMNKEGILHIPIGKVSFEVDHLEENINAVLKAVGSSKPQGLKGLAATTGFLKKCHLSSTMGRSVIVPKDLLQVKLH